MMNQKLFRHKQGPLRLRTKLVLFTALVLVLACATLGWLFIHQQVNAVTDGLVRSGTLLAHHLAATSQYSVFAGDRSQISRLAREILAADEVAFVTITAMQGHLHVAIGKGDWEQVLTSAPMSLTPLIPVPINQALTFTSMKLPVIVRVEFENGRPAVAPRDGFSLQNLITLLSGRDVPIYYDIGVPILPGPPLPTQDAALRLLLDEGIEHSQGDTTEINRSPLGLVEVGLSTLTMQDVLRRLVWQVVAVTLLIMLIGLAAIVILTHRMTTPLRNLTTVASRVATGDFTVTLGPIGRDEIGDLTLAFSHMLQSIREREESLTELNRTLEERIAGRTEQLQVANEKLQELDRRKSLFVSTASHELRTPLTSIKVHLDNLLTGVDGPLTESQNQVLSRIQVNLGRLQHLLEELLDLSRIELGQTNLELKPVDTAAAVTHTVDSLQSLGGRKGVTFSTQFPSNLPLVSADANKLHQVLTNLLHNAVKFSPERGTISVIGEHSRDGYVRISIRDSGSGIAPEEADKIFQPFYRSLHIPSYVRGTGLGLPIAKHLVELHQGRLWVESTFGRGSCFTFTLPVWTSSGSSSEVPIASVPLTRHTT